MRLARMHKYDFWQPMHKNLFLQGLNEKQVYTLMLQGSICLCSGRSAPHRYKGTGLQENRVHGHIDPLEAILQPRPARIRARGRIFPRGCYRVPPAGISHFRGRTVFYMSCKYAESLRKWTIFIISFRSVARPGGVPYHQFVERMEGLEREKTKTGAGARVG